MRSDRLLAILLTLQSRGRMTAPALAERLEVSVRTVYRDVEALSAAGVPIYTEQGRGGGIALLPGYRTDATGLTAAEARALFAFSGRGVLGEATADRTLQAAFRKLLAALPEDQRAAATRSEERILVEPQPWMRKRLDAGPVLTALQEAAIEGQRVRLRYQSARRTEPADSIVDVVGLVVKAGVWYLVGYRDGEARMFRVSRATGAELLGPAQLPPGAPPLAELWDRLRTAFERPDPGAWVTLRAARDSLRWVMGACSRAIVAEPERSPDPGDPTAVVLRLGFRSLDQACYTLTPVAQEIDVLDPPELRAALAAIGEAIVTRHGPPPGPDRRAGAAAHT